MSWSKTIPPQEIQEKVTNATVAFAEEFGKYLGTDDAPYTDNRGRRVSPKNHLTTSQLRRFFGEVKRQQMVGYDETAFVLLKPKLAYAVGRAKEKDSKIKDFYMVMSKAIDLVHSEAHFKNFIKVFEAIVAFHKTAEEGRDINN